MLKISLPVLLLALLTLTTLAPSQQVFRHTLTGKVTTPDSSVIQGLRLQFQGVDKPKYAVTDNNGKFEIDLEQGDHIVTIEPVELYPFKAFIKIDQKGPNPTDLNLTVDPSRVCCNQSTGVPFPKPLSLPKPPFPPAARAVRATGEVIVNVSIDRDGNVISATALSGHPLLKAASVSAAKRSKFEPAENGNERDARLVYVFIVDDTENKTLVRYSNQYRVIIIPLYEILSS